MKRIFCVSLMLIALCPSSSAQDDRQMSTQNYVSVSDVTSIPLSDSLLRKEDAPEKSFRKSARESSTLGADSSTAGEKKRYWVEAEYLNWRIKGSNLPPLVQTRIFTVIPPANGEVLLGGREVNPGNAGGGRITAGMWLNQRRNLGVEASYFYLGPRSINQSAGGNGDCPFSSPTIPPIIIRPFINALSTTPLYVISSPCSVRGTVTFSLASHLQGAEANAVYEPVERRFRGVRLIGGFRFLDLKERLTIIDTYVHSGAQSLGEGSDSFYLVTDEFTGRNRFYGGQGGVEKEFGPGRLSLKLSGKVALGAVKQLVNIGGSTFRSLRASQNTRVGGFLALDTNIGRYERTRLAVLPEARASLGYQFTDNLQAFAGYDFLYISRVARPVEQIDLNINWHHVPYMLLVQTPAVFARQPRLPEFRFNDSPFWAQGLTLGVRARF